MWIAAVSSTFSAVAICYCFHSITVHQQLLIFLLPLHCIDYSVVVLPIAVVPQVIVAFFAVAFMSFSLPYLFSKTTVPASCHCAASGLLSKLPKCSHHCWLIVTYILFLPCWNVDWSKTYGLQLWSRTGVRPMGYSYSWYSVILVLFIQANYSRKL